jgi:DNA-binding NarL/FixJ family response regulator
VVADEATGAAALDAWSRGTGLALELQLSGSSRLRLLEDLSKLAPEPSAARRLTDEQRQLLDLLAAGTTVSAAATQLHISRRTASRALADARRALGVDSTAAAVRRWVEELRTP